MPEVPRPGRDDGARPPDRADEHGLVRQLPSRTRRHDRERPARESDERLQRVPLLRNTMNDNVDRRDFLKLAGFSLAAVSVTGCTRPLVDKAIPYLTAPEEIVPGRAYYV